MCLKSFDIVEIRAPFGRPKTTETAHGIGKLIELYAIHRVKEAGVARGRCLAGLEPFAGLGFILENRILEDGNHGPLRMYSYPHWPHRKRSSRDFCDGIGFRA